MGALRPSASLPKGSCGCWEGSFCRLLALGGWQPFPPGYVTAIHQRCAMCTATYICSRAVQRRRDHVGLTSLQPSSHRHCSPVSCCSRTHIPASRLTPVLAPAVSAHRIAGAEGNRSARWKALEPDWVWAGPVRDMAALRCAHLMQSAAGSCCGRCVKVCSSLANIWELDL